jgi:uncharacterized protein (TIGR03083 family)
MTMTDDRPRRDSPRRAAIARDTATALASNEYARMHDLLASIRSDEWHLPTECPAWTVRDMAGHVLGMATMVVSLRETVRQNRVAKRRGGVHIDALTGLQVEENRHLSRDELIRTFGEIAPRAVRGRRRVPGLIRRMPLDADTPDGGTERWTTGFLLDVVLTRDTWMHRVDISRATDRPLELTADHDGRLVADVVEEWAGRHGHPFDLVLTGPAGGHYRRGVAEQLELDAVEFCRILSGREIGSGLMQTAVPF